MNAFAWIVSLFTSVFVDLLQPKARLKYRPRLFAVRSDRRRIMKARSRKAWYAEELSVARNELDSHADTSALGPNWVILEDTGKRCSVSPFSDQYEARRDVAVVTAATKYTHPFTGRAYILVLNEGLWFGEEIEHSLLNPNQLRAYGCKVNDDPTDRKRPFGLKAPETDVSIPFYMDGTIVNFESMVPTQEELERLPHIHLTSDRDWDPTASIFDREPSEEDGTYFDDVSYRISAAKTLQHWEEYGFPFLDEDEPELQTPGTVYKRCLAKVQVSQVKEVSTSKRHTEITPENMAKLWQVGLKTAKETLECTKQRGIRRSQFPIWRRYRHFWNNLNRRRLPGLWYTDTLVSKVKSFRQNRYAQIISNGRFTRVYPMRSKAGEEVAHAVSMFFEDFGVPEELFLDQATEQIGDLTDLTKLLRRNEVKVKYKEKGRHKQMAIIDTEIRELRKRWKRMMTVRGAPSRVWDYGMVYQAELMSITKRTGRERTGYEEVLGQTHDISEWCDFGFYETVQMYEESSDSKLRFGKWLGIASRVGSDLTYWILTENGKVLSSSTVQHVTQSDIESDDARRKLEAFNKALEEKSDDEKFVIEDSHDGRYIEDDIPVAFDERMGTVPVDDSEYGAYMEVEQAPVDPEEDAGDYFDKYIGAQVIREIGGPGEKQYGTVKRRARDSLGNLLGEKHRIPMYDTREYEVEWEGGLTDRLTANIIAESVYSNCDEFGNSSRILHDIVGHEITEEALKPEEAFYIDRRGVKRPKRTTRGVYILAEWKDGSVGRIELEHFRRSYAVELAEYAVAVGIDKEPAFVWWVSNTLKTRNRVLSKVKANAKYWRTSHKFGIELPHSVEEAYKLDDENKNTYWHDAIEKEMKKVRVAFKEYSKFTADEIRAGKAAHDLVGFQEAHCRIVFDIKMDLTRKARFICQGFRVDTDPSINTYSSVVSRDSVRIAFLLAALHGVDITACDVSNAYLNAPNREKTWYQAGHEHGPENVGKVYIIVRALYGQRSAGAAWRKMFQDALWEAGWRPTEADPDVYRRASSVTTDAGTYEYYELLLVYTDDCLIISHKGMETIEHLKKHFELKDGSVGKPDIYLGASITETVNAEGKRIWEMSPDKYVKAAIGTATKLIQADGDKLKGSSSTPFPATYKPELDVTPELSEELHSRYLQLIGILRWACEIGRLDILYEVSVLSQYMANPREGHLQMVYNIFSYLQSHSESSICFDSQLPEIDESCFQKVTEEAWREFYRDAKEDLPTRMPKPLGKGVDITCFVDANHAGNLVTRRSHTGILIYVNRAPIMYYSKKQNTVEAATFGSELVAMRQAKEMIQALRYKIRCFGTPLNGPANVLCDNQGVVKNTSIPQSMLSKKHNAINYHAVREAAACGILRVGKEDTKTNLADLFTKSLSAMRRNELIPRIFRVKGYGYGKGE